MYDFILYVTKNIFLINYKCTPHQGSFARMHANKQTSAFVYDYDLPPKFQFPKSYIYH